MKPVLYIILLFFIIGCTKNTTEETLKFSGTNRVELEKVLDHYKKLGDKRKIKAAEFLIANMTYKYSYRGDILDKYDEIFSLFDSLYNRKAFHREPQIVTDKWNELKKKYGEIHISKLDRVFDCQTLSSGFLIENINSAFNAWEKSPLYNPDNFDLFCEYILPYRIANEMPESYRDSYYNNLKHILDTVSTPEGVIGAFHNELYNNRNYRPSKVLWDYPVELSISKMEKGHKGACRHLTTFGALAMRACGLPVTVDRAIWANRSLGHSWNVLILDSGKILPFDALERKAIKFAYKPAKIFRKTYSLNFNTLQMLNEKDVPMEFFIIDEKDVTEEYENVYNISIPILYKYQGEREKKLGVICVFDNKGWRAVHWGEIKDDKMHFDKMPSGIAYIGGYYENGEIIPATTPFLLRSDGRIDYCVVDENRRENMTLERKYPLSELMKNRAHGLLEMVAEGANNSEFNNSVMFFTQTERVFNVRDSLVFSSDKFKYVRLLFSKTRNANLAEVEFYGKKDSNSMEEKLEGKIIGYPPIEEWDNPYINAMDNDLETFFEKDKRIIGWVGLELQKPYQITRIRYCPRNDTNFILEGDIYELMYWNKTAWKRYAVKTADQYNTILFEDVPTRGLYLLHNQTRGKEERIFTYENGEQIWW